MNAFTVQVDLVTCLCLLCLYHDALAPYTAPIDKNPLGLNTHPAEEFVGLAADWPYCQTKCAEDSACIVFSLSSRRQSCQRYPPETAFTSGVQDFYGTAIGSGAGGPDTNIIGSIDRSSEQLLWLSLGYAARPSETAYTSGTTAAECQAKCDIDNHLLPCVVSTIIKFKTPHECLLGAGYQDNSDAWSIDAIVEQATTKVNPVVDPTGNGTRITASNLPPAPPNTTSIPFSMTNITTKSLIDNEPVPYISYTPVSGGWDDCAEECRNNTACRSFQWDENGRDEPTCTLYDIAVIGTIVVGRSAYGVIDKDTGSNAVNYLVPAFPQLRMVVLSMYDSVTSLEECAAKCYHFHLPIYCTSFQLDHDTSRCILYPFTIEYWTPSSVSLPVQGNVQMGVINGRKPYNHHYDYGEPARQLIPTTTTTTTTTITTTTAKPIQTPTLQAVHYQFTDGRRNDTMPIKTLTLVVGLSSTHKPLMCCHECFHLSQWCRAFDVDLQSGECRLFDHTLPANTPLATSQHGWLYGSK